MNPVTSSLTLAPGALRDDGMAAGERVEIECHEAGMPDFVPREMDRLYAHLYCSPRYFEAAQAMQDASFYVARAGGRYLAILPYRRSGGAVTVVSEYMTVDDEEIERFAGYMFGRDPSLRRISFPRVHAQPGVLSFPYRALPCSEDMVVQLPATVQDYEAALGKNMRRNIKRYTSALSKAFPDYRYELHLDGGIGEQDLRDIIALSCLRMKSKNIVPRFDETEIRWIVEFAKTAGIVGVARIGGKVAAGAIGFRIGDNYFMHVIAHHPQYNEFSLGILCYYHTICEGIARGAKRFHLLQGRYGYKYRLLAERRDIVHLDVYRSRASQLASLAYLARREVTGRTWLFKQWLLHDLEHKEGAAYRLLGRTVDALRRAKRAQGATESDP